MNFTQAQACHDAMLPPDNDTSASERRDAFLADQVRTSLDPMDQLIVQQADALKESPESINQIIIAASWKRWRRGDCPDEWGIALSDGTSAHNDRMFAILELGRAGALGMANADNCQLGKLVSELMADSFAERCVSAAEDEVMS
jgi:hypothetical protein